MKKLLFAACISSFLISSCSKEKYELVAPISLQERPLQLLLDESESGLVEDDDKIELVLNFADQLDPKGSSLSGVKIPHSSALRVTLQFFDNEGFNQWSEYLVGMDAFYEIDDCNTSADQNISLNPVLDLNTGTATFDLPAGITEVIVELETNPALFDNGTVDSDRGFKVKISNLSGTGANTAVKYLADLEWEVKVLDDEAIYGKWGFDFSNTTSLDDLKSFFGLINEDVAGLSASDIDEIELEVELDKITLLIVLVETETITECGVTEVVNKEIELEFDIEELTDLLNGDLELVTEVEEENGSVKEYTVKGSFTITAGVMSLEIEIENDDTTITKTFEFSK